MEKEKIAKKTLDILLGNIDNVGDLKRLECAIQDYQTEGINIDFYKGKVKKLRKTFNKICNGKEFLTSTVVPRSIRYSINEIDNIEDLKRLERAIQYFKGSSEFNVDPHIDRIRDLIEFYEENYDDFKQKLKMNSIYKFNTKI